MEQLGIIKLHNGVETSVLAPEFLEAWRMAHTHASYLILGAERRASAEEINPIVSSILTKVYGVVVSEMSGDPLCTLSRGSLDNTSYEKGLAVGSNLSNAQKKAENQPDQIGQIALDIIANISTNTGLLTA